MSCALTFVFAIAVLPYLCAVPAAMKVIDAYTRPRLQPQKHRRLEREWRCNRQRASRRPPAGYISKNTTRREILPGSMPPRCSGRMTFGVIQMVFNAGVSYG